MNILQVIPYFAWSYGGPVRVVYDISQELSKRGNSVTIFTTDVGMNGGRLMNNEKIKLENVSLRYFRCGNNWIANNMKLHISSEMLSIIKKELKTFDIIHLHESRGIPNIYIWYYAKKYNIPYILQAHGSSPKIIETQSTCRTISKIIYDSIIGRKIMEDASKIFALTKFEAELYKNIGIDEDKIEIISNGIDLSKYIELPERGEFRKKYLIKDNERIILYLGRIHRFKGIDLLVHAFKYVTNIFDDIKLVIVGPDDGFMSQLKVLIENLDINNKVLILGPLYNIDKLEAYVDAEIYILPSVYETFPITVLEACACGKPIIVTENCGVSDLVDKNKIGYVIEYDKDQLKNAIVTLLNNRELSKKFSFECKKFVTEFDIHSITLKLESLYKDVYENNRSYPN